jgi:SAM-dependent methyltransferase
MESPARRIIAHYQTHAHEWDADRQKVWNDKIWHERFAALLPPSASVLELGCGSGWPVARYLTECGHQVTGVDSSPPMIELARQRLPAQRWIVGDMRETALDRYFDGILAWDSFFHLDFGDQRRMFPIFAAHSHSGTVLMFNTGPQHGEAIGEYRGDPLFHASLDPSEYHWLLERNGFEIVQHVANDPEAGGRTVWLTKRVGQTA